MSSFKISITGSGTDWKASLTVGKRTIHAYGTTPEEATDLANLLAGSETLEEVPLIDGDLREGELRDIDCS